jgi:rhamnosyltransferase
MSASSTEVNGNAKNERKAESTRVGVVIPTLNAGPRLEVILTSLIHSKHNPRILIVDSSSVDGTRDVADKHGAEVIRIERESFNHGSSREMARKMLNTPIIVMFTQDIEPACGDLIDELVRPILLCQAVVTYGRQLPHKGAGLIEAFHRRFNYPAIGSTRSIDDVALYGSATYFCSNSCAAYSNDALNQVGGFPHVLMGEDTMVVSQLLKRGGRIAYVPSAVVYHSHNHSISEEFRRHFDAGYIRSIYCSSFRLNSDERRGVQYSLSLMHAVLRSQISLVPRAMASLSAKFLGYHCGRLGRFWPKSLCRRFSNDPNYWKTS